MMVVKLTCYDCGDKEKPVVQVVPHPNKAGTILRVPVCEDCLQKRLEEEREYVSLSTITEVFDKKEDE